MNQDTKTLKPPKPPKIGRSEGLAKNLHGAPENIRWGVGAWLSVSILHALLALVQCIGNFMDLGSVKQTLNQSLDTQQELRKQFDSLNISLDTLAVVYNLLMLGWMLLLSVVCAVLVWRAGRGAPYSRMILNVGSLYLALTALLMVFSSSSPADMHIVLTLTVGILTILCGVVAIVGMYFMSRPDNAEWLGLPSRSEVEKYAAELEKYRAEEKEQQKRDKEARKEARHKNKQD